MRVVLVLDVPAGPAELHTRAAQLAGEFGQLVTHSIPGVRARNAVVPAVEQGRPVAPRGARPGGLTVDSVARKVLIDGDPVALTYREFELIAYLSTRPGRIVSRAELMHMVWSEPEANTSRTVDTHVRRLRAKLGAYADAVTTVRGRGYRFDPGSVTRARPVGRQLGA